jgi:hypothetical protein
MRNSNYQCADRPPSTPFCTTQLLRARNLEALGVPLVELLAGKACIAGLGSSPVDATTALAPRSSGNSASVASSLSRLSSRLGDGRQGSGLRSRGSLLASRGSGGRGAGTAAGRTASPDLGAGHGELLAAVVDAEVGVGVGGLVSAGELDHGAGRAAAAANDLDLHARDVVLGLVDVGAVNTNVLGADEVLAVGSVLGDLGRDEVAVVVAPCGGGEVTAVANTLLEDLEPVAGSIVCCDTTGGGLGHVHETGARVSHLRANSELELDFITSIDGQDLSVASSSSTLVAADVRAVGEGSIADVGSGVGAELDGVVLGRPGRLSDVFECGLSNTTDDVCIEKVVSARELGDSAKGKSRELHSDRAVTNVVC